MSFTTAQTNYFNKIIPYAKVSQNGTGIPYQLIAAYWSWETDFGKNESSRKGNNHGGIKKNTLGSTADPVGQYAGYATITDYANDWARVLNIKNYGYPEVLAAARQGKSWETITKAFNASQYMERGYNVSTIIKRAKYVDTLTGGSGNTGSSGGGESFEIGKFSDEQYVMIGMAAVALVSLILAGGNRN